MRRPVEPVDVVLPPPSSSVATVAKGREYRWAVSTRKIKPTYLTIFLGTPPAETTLPKAVIAGWKNSITARALDARFTTDAAGQRHVVTVLFPHDAKHAKAAMTRLPEPATPALG